MNVYSRVKCVAFWLLSSTPLCDNLQAMFCGLSIMLCEYCQGITLERLRRKYQHAPSFKALKFSANSCSLCALLWNAVITHAGCEPCLEDLTEIHEEPVVLEAWTEERSSLLSYVVINSHGEDFLLPGRAFGKISLFAAPGTPAASIIAGREVTPDMSSPATFAVLSSWIQECATEHKDCFRLPEDSIEQLPAASTEPVRYTKKYTAMQEMPFLPSRVIDVGPRDGSQEPYLLDNLSYSSMHKPQKKGYYIALSHCWGKKQPLTTTRSTYGERTREIPLATLPPTFRDAVIIARTLSIRYLWIDSLCIIQDSKEDWYIQSARMGAIYALSFLTIDASGSPDSQGGCFAKGPISDSMACVLQPVDSPGDVHFTRYIDEMPFSQMETEDYTGKRAWCLQETVLPHRVVMYGSQMLGWLCDSKRISQQHGELGSAVGFRMEKTWGVEFTLQRWAFIVLNYTKRKITYEGDKLVALSGLAGEIHHVLKDEYLAGIWRNYLIDGLLWDVIQSSGTIRPTQYRAPSWSWASLEGPISMKTNASGKEDVLTEVIDTHIESMAENNLGQVSGGFLKLVGPLVELVLPAGLRAADTPVRVATSGDQTQFTMTCTFDIPEEECWSRSKVFCLAMVKTRAPNNRRNETWGMALLVVPANGGSTFSRVGSARIEDMLAFSKDVPKTSLTLV